MSSSAQIATETLRARLPKSISTRNVETVRTIYESFAADDIDAVVETWAPNVELIEPVGMVGSGTFRGADEVLDHVFDGPATDWEAVTVTPVRFIADGETVVALVTWRGVNVENGRTAAFEGAHVFDFEAGLVRRWTSYADSAVFNAAGGD